MTIRAERVATMRRRMDERTLSEQEWNPLGCVPGGLEGPTCAAKNEASEPEYPMQNPNPVPLSDGSRPAAVPLVFGAFALLTVCSPSATSAGAFKRNEVGKGRGCGVRRAARERGRWAAGLRPGVEWG